MRRFRPPIHLVVAAATVVGGVASFQGVDHLVLAKTERGVTAPGDAGHEPTATTSTTTHHDEPGPTTSTTVRHEPPPTTDTTIHHEPGPTTSTTAHHEPPPTTPTTKPGEPPKPPTPPGVEKMTLKCGTGMLADGRGAASCGWTESTSPRFHHYRLTRELVGTPRQTIFTTEDRGKRSYGDIGLQPGSEYSYIVEAYDAAGNLIGRGGPVHVTCCNGAVVTG
jgi:hypothetical protein